MNQLYRAIIKSMGGKYVSYGVQFASLMIMARLFPPEVFGVVAAAQVFFVLFEMLSEGGLTPAIINLGKLLPSDRDGIFGGSVVLGLVLGASFFLLTPLFVKLYAVNGIEIVIPYVAVALVFSAWTIVPRAFLQRQQLFFCLAISTALAEIGAVFFVYLGSKTIDPLVALSLRLPIFSLINFSLIFYFSKKTDFGRPMLGRNVSSIKGLLKSSKYQLGYNTLSYLSNNLDKILVAKFMGAAALGIYDRSYSFMRYPLQLLTLAMVPAIQPALRQHAGDPSYVKKMHLDLSLKLSILGVIGAGGIFFFAREIVLLAFGSRWLEAIPIIQVFSLIIPIQVTLSSSSSFFQVLGRTDRLFICGVFSAFINVIAISWGIYQGALLDLCWALFVAINVNFIQTYWVLYKKVFKSSFWVFGLRMLPAAIFLYALVGINVKFY